MGNGWVYGKKKKERKNRCLLTLRACDEGEEKEATTDNKKNRIRLGKKGDGRVYVW